MSVSDWLLLAINLVYGSLMLTMWIAWRRAPSYLSDIASDDYPFLSVIVAVRNEENTINYLLKDLNKQLYSNKAFEVIVVDDHSTDQTALCVHKTIPEVGYPLQLLHLQDFLRNALPNGNYKKKAIEYGIATAKGEWIVLTDGDCRVGSGWLSSLARTISQAKPQMISGPVTFYGEQTSFEIMQTVEFASLIGSGGATLQLGIPTMCNAANLVFSKSGFKAINGYAGTADTATGDDLFLMHKMQSHYPGKVIFLKNSASIVQTRAKATWEEFYQQRRRWASKWNLYQDWRVTTLAVFIFLANLSLTAGLLGYGLGFISLSCLLACLLLRFGAEFIFLRSVLLFLDKKKAIKWIFPVQLVYFLYVVFFGIIAQKRGYVWKGRKLY